VLSRRPQRGRDGPSIGLPAYTQPSAYHRCESCRAVLLKRTRYSGESLPIAPWLPLRFPLATWPYMLTIFPRRMLQLGLLILSDLSHPKADQSALPHVTAPSRSRHEPAIHASQNARSPKRRLLTCHRHASITFAVRSAKDDPPLSSPGSQHRMIASETTRK
jgi:hypothetical protein